ncbi:hypothetical protein MHBO_002732 [Bonamia ostreae]|uniref:Uncharacterized protein n=1 Tax=Bonamia ostreae TaxID=126728 RepID=A0ABV2ANB3_9EUKA
MLKKLCKKLFTRKTKLNPAYLDIVSTWRDYGVTRGDLNHYQDISTSWSAEMLKLERPNEFLRMNQRIVRYDRLYYERLNLRDKQHLVQTKNIENDVMAPYKMLYYKLVNEKNSRGIKKYCPAYIN